MLRQTFVRTFAFLVLLFVSAPSFGVEIRFFENIGVDSEDGKIKLYVKVTPFDEKPIPYELSAKWFENGEAGLQQLKMVRDLAKSRMLPIVVILSEATQANCSSCGLGTAAGPARAGGQVIGIEIRPEFTTDTPAHGAYRVFVKETGEVLVWTRPDGEQMETGKLAKALEKLEVALPERVIDGNTFYFSRLVKRGDRFYMQVKTNPLQSKSFTIPLAEGWLGENGMNIFPQLSIMANDAKLAIPVQITTLPLGITGREVASFKIVPSEVSEATFSVLAGMKTQIVLTGSGPKMQPHEAMMKLGEVLPSSCSITQSPKQGSTFMRFFAKFFKRG